MIIIMNTALILLISFFRILLSYFEDMSQISSMSLFKDGIDISVLTERISLLIGYICTFYRADENIFVYTLSLFSFSSW